MSIRQTDSRGTWTGGELRVGTNRGERDNIEEMEGRKEKTVCPGLVFIEKLQNDDLIMTSLVAVRRPNDDHIMVSRMSNLGTQYLSQRLMMTLSD